jgi:predicted phage terminase large subunit-like protein
MSTIIEIDGKKIDVDAQLLDIDKVDCEDSLYEFMKGAWRYIDPVTFTEGWPIEAIAEHLQAVVDGDIRRLIINIPPRMGKSSITSVAFPAWVWAQPWNTPTSGPGVQLLHASYSHALALRDSVKCRRLIESPWYQARWGDRFKLQGDQNTKGRFANDKNGERLITAVEARVTGEGGSIIVIDDPNAANEAFSEASIHTTTEWWDGTISTRHNDPKTGAFVIIQQRLSEEDLTGHILSKDVGQDWIHLCLPMRYEMARHTHTVIGWDDPRGLDDNGQPLVVIDENGNRNPRDPEAAGELALREGMLLWPERFGEKEVVLLEKQLGPWASAGQLQQLPSPKGGGIIKSDWWRLWESPVFPDLSYIVASLDTAYTTKTENDFSAMTVWGVFTGNMATYTGAYVSRSSRNGDLEQKRVNRAEQAAFFDEATRVRLMASGSGDSFPQVILMDAWQIRAELHELVTKVAQTCKKLKVDLLLIENKAAGYSVAQEMRRLYGAEDFGVQLVDPKSQDKLSRLYSVQHLFAEGLIWAPAKAWANMVIDQVSSFPKGKHDDLCLVGKTLIRMADGTQKRIDEIQIGEWVSTPNGPCQVSAASLTGVQPIWRMKHSFGELEGTFNHPVFANNKWKQLASLCPNDTLSLYQQDKGASWFSNQTNQPPLKALFSTGANIIVTQMQKIRRISGILAEQAIAFTVMFGNFTTDPFQRVIKFITLTAIPETMNSQTLNVCLSGRIERSILKNILSVGNLQSNWRILKKLEIAQKHGIQAMKVRNGIEKTPCPQFGLKALQNRIAKVIILERVNGAVRNLKQKVLKKRCARPFATQKNQDFCLVKSVKCTHTLQKVYNLTVDGTHCYYANDVLVHNCDTVSMAIRHMRDIGVLTRSVEWAAEIEMSMRHQGKNRLAPLYEV